MRIRFAKQSDGVDLDGSDNYQADNCYGSGDDHGEEVIKKKVVQQRSYHSPKSDGSLKSGENNLTLAQLCNSSPRTPSHSALSPCIMGKRRKKPKEMQDDFFYQLKEKRNKSSASKSKHAVSNHAGKATRSCTKEKTATNALHSHTEVKTPAMIRAEEVQLSLGSEFPSFVKLLVRSHVGSCFWMGLPMPFCKVHLPRKDFPVILEDECGQLFEMKFIAEKTGLSAGWRKFAVGHKLLEGDVLIFQLVEPNKFKVYIVRANHLTEVDGALSLLNLDALTKQNETGDAENGDIMNKKRKRPKSLPISVVQKTNRNKGLPRSVPKPIRAAEQFENDSEEVGSEVLVGPSISSSIVQFKDIKSFGEFHIMVDGLCIDSDIPEDIRIKYYELCSSQNAFIHTRLLQGLNCKLVAGIICETVNIANAIRECNLTTSQDEFESWEKTLKSFEIMGMNVGFLCARLRHLLTLAFESDSALETRRYMEAKNEQIRAEDEIRILEAKLIELREASGKFSADVEALKPKVESHERKFKEEVDAPW